jgi:hypothetical protein
MLRLLNFSFNGDIQYIESTVIFVLDELLYKKYQMATDSFNKNRSNENRFSLNLAKQRYKGCLKKKWLQNVQIKLTHKNFLLIIFNVVYIEVNETRKKL